MRGEQWVVGILYSEGNLPVLKRWAITIVVRSWLSINLSKAAWTMRSLSESNADVASSLCQDSVDMHAT